LDDALESIIKTQQQDNNLQLLPIKLAHIYALASLPLHHRDPFDRLLIAQATVEELSFVTVDGCIADYSVKLIT